MCGIVGYTGRQYAIPKITDGLSVLEYRGYDSAGVAAHDGRCITTVKCSGRVSDLKESEGNSSLRNHIIDAIYNMDAEKLNKGAKYDKDNGSRR